MNKETGKIIDYITAFYPSVWDIYYIDVWADAGLKSSLSTIEGVTSVYEASKYNYHVYADKRYDVFVVRNNIERMLYENPKTK